MFGIIQNKIYIKKENERQQLRLFGGSWTINLNEIQDKEINEIKYVTPNATYIIDFQEAFLKGFIRIFKDETKLIVPLKYWTIIKGA